MDIFRPDSGSIQVFGHHFLKEDKGRIGYLPEERGLYTRQKVQAVIEYFVQLKGVPQPQARINTLDWLKRLDMLDVKDSQGTGTLERKSAEDPVYRHCGSGARDPRP